MKGNRHVCNITCPTLLKGYTLDTSLKNVSDGPKNLYKRSRSESVQAYCFAPDSIYTVVREKSWSEIFILAGYRSL